MIRVRQAAAGLLRSCRLTAFDCANLAIFSQAPSAARGILGRAAVHNKGPLGRAPGDRSPRFTAMTTNAKQLVYLKNG